MVQAITLSTVARKFVYQHSARRARGGGMLQWYHTMTTEHHSGNCSSNKTSRYYWLRQMRPKLLSAWITAWIVARILCDKLKIFFTASGTVCVNFIAFIGTVDAHPALSVGTIRCCGLFPQFLEKYSIIFFSFDDSRVMINNCMVVLHTWFLKKEAETSSSMSVNKLCQHPKTEWITTIDMKSKIGR